MDQAIRSKPQNSRPTIGLPIESITHIANCELRITHHFSRITEVNVMATKVELQERIAELEVAQARAEVLNRISRGLSVARDEDELLQVLSRPATEAGTATVTLMYIDLNEVGEPEWLELVASWQREEQQEDTSSIPMGSRFKLSEFPFSRLWMASPDKPQLIADVTTDERVDENFRNLLTSMGVYANAIIPLTQAGRWVGMLVFSWDEPHEFSEQEAEIYRALIGLASPAVENRRLLAQTQKTLDELRRLEMAVEQSIDGIAIPDLDGNIEFVNSSWAQMHGYTVEELLGQHLSMFHTEEQLQEDVIPFNERVMETGAHQGEVGHVRKDGTTFPTWMSTTVLKDEKGNPVGLVGTARDITEQKQSEVERERLQQELIEAQRRAIQELSTPIIPLMERIIVMPLIGSIDSMRARDIMRSLLAGIREQRAKVVILDITGVPIVDSGVANHLNKTIQAARLKGAHTIITGISDAVAETIVDLGIDWGGIETLSDVQTGLIVALNSLGIKLASRA
jgi:PAS domain S-box-containing protein